MALPQRQDFTRYTYGPEPFRLIFHKSKTNIPFFFFDRLLLLSWQRVAMHSLFEQSRTLQGQWPVSWTSGPGRVVPM